MTFSTRLPHLNWFCSGVSIPASSGSTDVFANYKTMFQNAKYWQLVETPNTGSLSLLIQPKAANSVGSAANINIVITTNLTGATAYHTPDSNANSAGVLGTQIGMTPDITENGSGSFKGAQADFPFQTDTGNPRWSGYWQLSTFLLSASFLIESEESFFLGQKMISSGVQGALVGCILEPFSSGAGENGGRCYGISTTGANDAGSTLWTNGSGFMSGDSLGANGAHIAVFIVSGGVKQTGDYNFILGACTAKNNLDFSANNGGSDDVLATAGPSPKSIHTPIVYGGRAYAGAGVPQPTSFRAMGMSRGFFMCPQAKYLNKVVSGSTTVGYTLGHFAQRQNTVSFFPASGSGL